MLFRHLCLILNSRIVVKSTSHKITSFATIFASPSIFYCLIYRLLLHEVEMTLGFDEITIPFLYFPKVLLQHLMEATCSSLMKFICLYFLDQRNYRHYKSRRIHFKDVFINEFQLWHQRTHLKTSYLLSAYPAKHVNFSHPIMNDIDCDTRIVVGSNW